MSGVRAHRNATGGFAVGLVGLTLAVSGCGGGSSKTAAAAPAGSSTRPQASVSVPVTAPTNVVAKGGGDFCKLIATASNTGSIGGTSVDEIKKRIAQVKQMELQAIALTPDSLKSDVNLLFHATDQIYTALARANYDYSKLNQSDLKGLQEPDVRQAAARVQTYITNVCKISS